MKSTDATDPHGDDPTFGYLAFLEDEAVGFTGGYLIVTATGRPLEFHCTAPLAASRAQQILFGPTLRPYLLGEQLGRTLVRRSAIKASVVVIADADAAPAAADLPVVRLAAREPSTPDQPAAAPQTAIRLPGVTAWAHQRHAQQAERWLQQLTQSVDPCEPFERITQAIREAQRLGQGQPGDQMSGNRLSANTEASDRRAA
ncbi:MAG: hypothetical protein AAF790_08820 [Planctomycetota bacterium]